MTTMIDRSAADAHGGGVSAATHYRTATIDGLNIFYREAGPKDAPVVLLLHGFPSSSHMFRNLIPQLADAYHVIVPDYPAFGHSDAPDPSRFTYSFHHVAEVIDDLLDALGVRRFAPYMMDIGAAIGFRLAVKHPDAVWAIVAQNGPLYGEDGGEEFFATMAGFWQDGSEEHRNAIRGFLTPESTRAQYLVGVADPSLVDPDSWLVDQALLDRPGVDEIMLDHLFEVRNRPSTIDGLLEFSGLTNLPRSLPPARTTAFSGSEHAALPGRPARCRVPCPRHRAFRARGQGRRNRRADARFLERVLAKDPSKTVKATQARNARASTGEPTSRTHVWGATVIAPSYSQCRNKDLYQPPGVSDVTAAARHEPPPALDFGWWASNGPTAGYPFRLALEAAPRHDATKSARRTTGRCSVPPRRATTAPRPPRQRGRWPRAHCGRLRPASNLRHCHRSGIGLPGTEQRGRRTAPAGPSCSGLRPDEHAVANAAAGHRGFEYRPVSVERSTRDFLWISPMDPSLGGHLLVVSAIDCWYPAHFMSVYRAHLERAELCSINLRPHRWWRRRCPSPRPTAPTTRSSTCCWRASRPLSPTVISLSAARSGRPAAASPHCRRPAPRRAR